MFGKKKSEDKPAAPKAPSKASGKKFDPKEFMLSHVEKFVFGFIAITALGLVYLGATKEPFDSQKNPEKLSNKSQETVRKINEDHWPAIKNEEARVKGITDVSYAAKAVEATQPMASVAIGIEQGDPTRIRERRIDPEILAARQLEAKYFFGPYVISSSTPQYLAVAEFLNKLPDAKVKEDAPKKESTKGGAATKGGGKGGQQGGGSGKFGMQGGGAGMGGGPSGGKKFLAAGYDRGFPAHTLAQPSDKKKVLVARDIGFVAVTALAPHQELEAEYRSKLARAGNVLPGRDTPNYVGFEVQRVDVTDAPGKEVPETDWQDLPNAGSEILKERSKSTWLGTNQEVVAQDWTTWNLTMPIPPVLLKEYAPFVTHSEVPKSSDPTIVSAPGSNSMGQFNSDNSGDTSSDSGMDAFPGLGAGSGGGGGGANSFNNKFSGGGAAAGGKFGGGGSPPGGKFGGMGGKSPSGAGSAGGNAAPPSAETPEQLPSTKYKLVRFYDFEAKANRVYRYRVRLLMYDPNFPEAPSIQPRSSSLDVASGTLKRVQELLDKERKGIDSAAKQDDAKPYMRKSSRKTAWSEASAPISTARTIEGFLGDAKIFYSADREQRVFETSPPRAEMVIAEWDSKNAIFVPRHDTVMRGYVFGLPNRDGGKDLAFEIIHPITKYIKSLAESKPKSLVAVIELTGLTNLESKVPKDPHLKSGAKGVAYDPEANRIIVVREFDDFTGYGMQTAPEKTAVGPLGGPLKLDASSSMGGGMGGGMGGSSGTGKMGGFGGAAGGLGGFRGGEE